MVEKIPKECSKIDEYWMRYAIKLAKFASDQDEIPVGAVLVLNNSILGEGWNQSISSFDPTAHAEIIAIRKGGKKIKNYRLLNTSIYVTQKPCIMCFGALIHARVHRLIFGSGKCEDDSSLINERNLFNLFKINHKILLTSGVLETDCKSQIETFFMRLREKIKRS